MTLVTFALALSLGAPACNDTGNPDLLIGVPPGGDGFVPIEDEPTAGDKQQWLDEVDDRKVVLTRSEGDYEVFEAPELPMRPLYANCTLARWSWRVWRDNPSFPPYDTHIADSVMQSFNTSGTYYVMRRYKTSCVTNHSLFDFLYEIHVLPKHTLKEDSDCENAPATNKFTIEAASPGNRNLSWMLEATPTNGTVSLLPGQTNNSVEVCYTPNTNATGSDSFRVSGKDTSGNVVSVRNFPIEITPLQDCPTIDQGNSMNISVVEGSTCGGTGNTFTLSATDPDTPAGSLSWSHSGATKGTVTLPGGTLGASVQVCYTPNSNATGSDTFTVSVGDGSCGGLTSITVNVTITPVDDCPSITQGGSMSISVLQDSTCASDDNPADLNGNKFTLSATDPDTPPGSLSWSHSAATKGTVTLPGGTLGASVQVCYTPNLNATGSDTFTVSVGDGSCGGLTSITVNVTITPVDDCPSITQGGSMSISVLQDSTCGGTGNTFTLNATDPDSPAGSLTWSIPTQGTKGTGSFVGANTGSSVQVCYTPNAGQLGSDSFVVRVTDNTCGGGGLITVNVTINPFACPSINQGSQLSINVQEDSQCNGVGNTFTLSATDPDSPAGSLAWTTTTPPGMGSVSYPNGTTGTSIQVCYTPNPDATGNDSFVVSVSDGTCGGSGSITINVTLTPIADCPIIGQGDSISMTVQQNSTCGGAGNTVVLSATDPDSAPGSLTWSSTTPLRGVVSFPNGNSGSSVVVCYTPSIGKIGSDSFVVTVEDGTCGGGDTITVNVTINPLQCPTITQGSLLNITVEEDSNCGGAGNTFTLNATDPDSPAGSLSWSHTSSSKGSVSFLGANTGGTVTLCYTPNPNAEGSDAFLVSVSDNSCDGLGMISVHVSIMPIPDCPVIDQGSLKNVTVAEDSQCGDAGNTFMLSATDPDTPAGSLNWIASPPTKGTVTFPGGSTGTSVQVCYRPGPNATGSDTFVVTVGDGTCGTSTITVNVIITPVDDCPTIAQGGSMNINVVEDSTCGGAGNTFNLSATDPDSPAASFTWSSTVPLKGSVSFPGGVTGGTVQVCYTPNANATGADSFVVSVSDGTACTGGGRSITVNVTITPVEDCPTITQGSSMNITVIEDSNCGGAGNTFTLNATDPDTPAGSLHWSTTVPTRGVVSFPGGTTGAAVVVCYRPNADVSGSDSFVVSVADGACGVPTSIVVNVSITPVEDCPSIDQGSSMSITVQEDSTCAGPSNTFTLSASDPDTPRGGLTWSSSTPTKGSVSFPNGDSGDSVQVCYTPNADANGSDSFVVSVSDGTNCTGGGGSITISVNILPVPDCPTIGNGQTSMAIGVAEDSDCGGFGNQFTLSASDPDSALSSLLWSATLPMKGTVSFPSGNDGESVEICYTPHPDADGSDVFVVSVSDGTCGGASMITVNVTIDSIFDCPTIDQIGPLQLTVQEGSTCAGSGNVVTLTASDPDSPAGSLIWSLTSPSQGTASFQGGNTGGSVQICYTPNMGATGSDSFSVSVVDDVCKGNEGSLIINVTINPLACPTITQGSLLNLTVVEDSNCGGAGNTFTLNATDTDTPPASLMWSATNPTKGTASFVSPATGPSVQVCYTPNADATGSDVFVVSVADGQCGSAHITVAVQIEAVADCPSITEVGPISVSVSEDSICGSPGNIITLSATDPDSPSATLSWSASSPSKGTVSFIGGSIGGSVQICYTPAPNATGADSFVVSVTDGTCKGADSVTVNVNIDAVADCPSIDQTGPINLNVQEDSTCGGGNTFTLSATDPDTPGGTLSWSATTPSQGVVSFPGGNNGASVQVCYTPNTDANGADSFVVSVSDGNCGGQAGSITVNVNIAAVNDCPVVTQGGSKSIVVQRNSDCGGAGNQFTLNATDAEGDAIFWSASMPAKGAVSFPGGTFGGSVVVCYKPNPGASGADAFIVTVTDSAGGKGPEGCQNPNSIVINVGIHCGAVSGDCNGNGIPDNCEIADNPAADSDGDGILNVCDACPNDATNDSDGDGVCDSADQCPNTPPGTKVGPDGCPLACQDGDSDNDGVCNSVDQCPNTPPGTAVDAVGCPLKPEPQPRSCDPNDNDTLSLLMSVLFRAPVCGCGIMLTGLVSLLGIVGMKANRRRNRRRPGLHGRR